MEFSTLRLTVGPLSQGDGERVIDLFCDELVGQTYMLPDFADRAAARPLFERILALSQDASRYVAGIFYEKTCIGILNETDRAEDRIELGYALLPAFHNRGFATEALKGAIAFLFGAGFRVVTAAAFSENGASLRVMEKAGMHPNGFTEEITYRGRDHRCIYYEIQKDTQN